MSAPVIISFDDLATVTRRPVVQADVDILVARASSRAIARTAIRRWINCCRDAEVTRADLEKALDNPAARESILDAMEGLFAAVEPMPQSAWLGDEVAVSADESGRG